MPRTTFVSLVAACALALLAVTAGAVSSQRAQRLTPADISPAFSIPSSDLVFEGLLTLPSGQTTPFEAREGSVILVDHTPDDPNGRLGIVLTLNRRLLRKSGELGFHATITGIGPDPRGGDYQYFLTRLAGSYKEDLKIAQEVATLTLNVRNHHFEDFKDGLLITMLWEAVERDKDALRGLYSELNTLYGPTSQECKICDGVLLCGTSVSCGDDGDWGS